jgi:hypothetical protein
VVTACGNGTRSGSAFFHDQHGRWSASRLSDGTTTSWVSVEDPEFIADIERGEKFAQRDMLRCRLRVVQHRRPGGGLRTEYHLIRVVAHPPGVEQPELWPRKTPLIEEQPGRALPPGDALGEEPDDTEAL